MTPSARSPQKKALDEKLKERQKFLKAQAAIVAQVNAPEGVNIAQLVTLSGGGLRRIYTEIEKIKKGGKNEN